MNDQNIQNQIDALNQKMDLVLEYVREQKMKSQTVEDLISDATIIGKDIYDTTVDELDRHSIDLEPTELTKLGIIFLRNIKTFISIMNTMESTVDLLKEMGPIANEIIIDASKKLGEFEQKGYFTFLKEVTQILDNIVTGFTTEDVKALADNIVTILDTVKNLTQPQMMKSADNALMIFSKMETENIPEYSIWKAMREMNSPEMRKSIGFMITFLRNLSKSTNIN